ncbi:MAG: nucleotidyl transferase AbiEii/AbiGii toxin family protein [Deltaproteobacteria bacterium]|nr:nucleotidyl transferase AbiEii/AbiGii toxin family protein [Deltaproteobacteria bacterium]
MEYKLVRKSKRLELSDNVETLRRVAQEVGASDRKTFRIEISKFEHCSPKREAELDDYTIFVYSPEQIVVEKIRSICRQMTEYGHIVKSRSQSPRPKDFLDIYVVMKHFGIDLTTPENLDLVRCSFESKRVPLRLIGRTRDHRNYHLGAFDAVRDTIYRGKDVKDFDFYFDYVVSECEKLKPLWEE